MLDEATIGALIATFVRTAALAATAPVIGDHVPVRARLVFVVAVAFGVGFNREGIPLEELPAALAIDLATGLLTGTCAKFVLAKVAIAGQLMGLSLGLGFAAAYDPNAEESAGTLRTILMTLAGIAFVSVGGLEAIVRAAGSKPAHVTDVALLGPELLRQGTAAFGQGLALAGPVVLAALVANVGLAVMNRAAPAVNVFSISLAAVLIIGGFVLLATSSSLIGGIVNAANRAVATLQ